VTIIFYEENIQGFDFWTLKMSIFEKLKKLSRKKNKIITTREGNFLETFFRFSLQKCSANAFKFALKYIILLLKEGNIFTIFWFYLQK